MSHNTLENYYQLLYALKKHHGWDFSEVEAMIPYELDLYTAMLKADMTKSAPTNEDPINSGNR